MVSSMQRISLRFLFVLVLCCYTINVIIRYNFSDEMDKSLIRNYTSTQKSKERIVLCFVVCENRLNLSLNVVKSVLLFTREPVHLVIFADDVRRMQLNETLTRWQNITANQFHFELHNISLPEPVLYWSNLSPKCTAQRLFLPKLLPNIDALIYVDADTLFLGPIEELWNQFSKFNATQITALALEHNTPNKAWYPRFAKHPFYGEYGVNAGVILMNLTRMREFGWVESITPVVHTWRNHMVYVDQDIINIIVSNRSAAVRVLDCRYNYRTDQCAYGHTCAGAARGIFLLHGSRCTFSHKNRQPAFRACYEAVAEHQLGSEPPERVLYRLHKYLSRVPPSPCRASKGAFLRVPSDTLRARYPRLEKNLRETAKS